MKILKICTLLFVFALLCWSCKEDEETPTNGLSNNINNLVSQDLLDEMISLGMPIHTGSTPPVFENIYLLNPMKLIASNRPNDDIGAFYADLKAKFTEQNNQTLTTQMDIKQGSLIITGLESFIAGNGNLFTVFARVETTQNSHTYYLLNVISGEVVEGGLNNMHFALFMLDDNGDPTNGLIENGDGRIFKDDNGFSPIQSFFRGASTPELDDKKLLDAISIE